MEIRIDPHARMRMIERGLSEDEVRETVSNGQPVPAGQGRQARAMVFEYNREWGSKVYPQKKVKVVYVERGAEEVVVTVYAFYGTFAV